MRYVALVKRFNDRAKAREGLAAIKSFKYWTLPSLRVEGSAYEHYIQLTKSLEILLANRSAFLPELSYHVLRYV